MWIDSKGQPEFLGDPYGHDKRVLLGLEQKWAEIDRGVEIAAHQTEKLPNASQTTGLEQATKKRTSTARNDDPAARARRHAKTANAEESRPSSRGYSTRGSVGQMMNAAYLQ